MTEHYSRGAAVKKKPIKKKPTPQDAPIGTGYAKGAKNAILETRKKQKRILDQL